MKRSVVMFGVLGVVGAVLTGCTLAGRDSSAGDLVNRGRYLARVAGCNDCHTPGYAEKAGDVPETQWLTGDQFGWRGPWGTTYAINLRLYMNGMTEAQWLTVARAVRSRPPMPWFALRDMTDEDLRALYHYTRSLGPAGAAAPPYLPPGQTPSTPFVQFPEPPKKP